MDVRLLLYQESETMQEFVSIHRSARPQPGMLTKDGLSTDLFLQMRE